MDSFPPEVQQRLGWYVYRLIDPRTGVTFYVGKGRGNRVFSHARGLLSELIQEDDINLEVTDGLKIQTIRDIQKSRLCPIHLIHRHGIESEEIAYQIEAALIDAYPGLSNVSGGHGSSEFGCRHVEEIVRIYSAEPMYAYEDLILIYIGRPFRDDLEVFDSVRAAWRMSKSEAQRRRLVLAYDGGIICGAYRPKEWLEATKENFPHLKHDLPGRIGFKGEPAHDVWDLYVNRRAPTRKRGAQTQFSYIAKMTD
nr:hypothetical protein [Brevundimonas subvibrioides]